MSSPSSVDVEVRLKLKDGATAGVKAISQTAQQEAAKTATATEKAAQKAAEATEKGAARQRSSYEKLSHAREMLGVRSERAIQREIQQTEAAYNRLSASGTLSWQQQAAAADKMRQHVTQLTNEMGKLTAAQKAYAGVRFGAAGLAGTAAAAYTLKAPAMTAMSFDERLAHMANTAFSGQRDKAGRKMGMKELEEAITTARKKGGGTREQAAEALDTMIASNAVDVAEAIKILPTVVKQAKGADANPNEIALTAVRSMQTFGITADELESVLSGAQVAGQKGSFELKNMAKWLPEQMAMAKVIGISGKSGFAKLAAWNEASAITAGTKDEAGNNLRDLFNELNTPHFRKYMSEQYLANGHKAKKGDKERLEKNLDSIYLDYAARGVNKVDATTDMMNTIFSRNEKYQELQSQLKGLGDKDPKRKEILESMAAQVQGTAVGKIFHNQQSLMALLGVMGNTKVVADVERGVFGQYTAPADMLESRTSHSVISDTPGYKVEQAKEDKTMAQKSVMDSLTPAIGKAAEAFSDLASKHPLLVGTTTLATAALGALAGAAGLASIAMGGKGPGGAIGKAAAWATASKAGQNTMKVAKVGGIAGMSALVGDYALEKAFGEQSAISRYGSSALNGAALGATVGSVVPVLGTGIGAALGGSLGLAWEGIKDLLKPAEQKPLDVNANMTVGLAPGLVLQSQSMQATGGNVTMNTGNVWNGAP